jgi:hypothetical protein
MNYLEPDTSFEELKSWEEVVVYHGSGESDLSPRSNLHCGSFLQSLFRTDFKVNDEEVYKHGYIYEIKCSLEGLNKELFDDDGKNQNLILEDSYKNLYNVLAYKNVAEGFAKDNNISLIILKEINIISFKLDSIWSGPAIESFLDDEYLKRNPLK